MRPSMFGAASAGRWIPRSDPQPEAGPEFSTPRAACTLQSGDQVLVSDAWRTIERAERLPYLPDSAYVPQTLLHLTNGGILATAFDYVYDSRDEDEQALAAEKIRVGSEVEIVSGVNRGRTGRVTATDAVHADGRHG
jgi:hypothetical protein